MQILHKNGDITLDGDQFSLKIDSKRRVYVRKAKDKVFHIVDQLQIPPGLDKVRKERLLYEWYSYIVENTTTDGENE